MSIRAALAVMAILGALCAPAAAQSRAARQAQAPSASSTPAVSPRPSGLSTPEAAPQPQLAAPSTAPVLLAEPDAIAIFDRTCARVAHRTLPPYIAYTEYAAFERRGKIQAQQNRIVIRTADGKANITPVKDSPADRIDTTPRVDRPIVYPTTSFGLVKRAAGETASSFETTSTPLPDAQAGGVPVIGHVASRTRDYDPTLLGIEQLGGVAVYHLKLVPRFDPQHHPIRDLYVDMQTFDPRRIDIEVFASAGPVRSRPTVVVDFEQVDGTWVIDRASMDFVLRFGFLSYSGSGAYRTSDFAFPAAEPDWLFDAKALAEHARAGRAAP